MVSDTFTGSGLKQKAVHEFWVFIGISLYLAFFFCAVVTNRTILQRDFHDAYLNYGIALINAFVVAKAILIGEYAHLGKKHEAKPLLLSSVYKPFLFSLLVFGFHIVEEVIKQVIHGRDLAGAFRDTRIDDLLSRGLIIFCTFVPFFAFRELQRVLGEDSFLNLFFRKGAITDSRLAAKCRSNGEPAEYTSYRA